MICTGPVNPGSWTNQGPPQWDQANSVDNQQMSGQFPQGAMPQNPYNQQEQNAQFQNGTYSTLCFDKNLCLQYGKSDFWR